MCYQAEAAAAVDNSDADDLGGGDASDHARVGDVTGGGDVDEISSGLDSPIDLDMDRDSVLRVLPVDSSFRYRALPILPAS